MGGCYKLVSSIKPYSGALNSKPHARMAMLQGLRWNQEIVDVLIEDLKVP